MNKPQGSHPEAPPPGRYRHYKGPEYQVLGVARHSETEEDHVVYRPLYGRAVYGYGPWPCLSSG